jgi:hypothetical protein
MSGNTYLARDPTTQLPKEIAASQTSAGSGSAGQIVALNSSGVLDSTLFPAGLGEASITVVASESLAAGAMVNLWSNAGVLNVRNANATDATKPVSGFVASAFASSATATVYFFGQLVTGVSGLTIGAPVYLATTAGGVTPTAPSASGNLVCVLSQAAISATEFVLEKVSSIIHA